LTSSRLKLSIISTRLLLHVERFCKSLCPADISLCGSFVYFSLAVNLVCFNWTEAPILYPDSHRYIEPAVQLKQGRLLDFSLRSPTYPVYLGVMGLFGKIVNRRPLELAVYGQIVRIFQIAQPD
jgi:hypothetical protein